MIHLTNIENARKLLIFISPPGPDFYHIQGQLPRLFRTPNVACQWAMMSRFVGDPIMQAFSGCYWSQSFCRLHTMKSINSQGSVSLRSWELSCHPVPVEPACQLYQCKRSFIRWLVVVYIGDWHCVVQFAFPKRAERHTSMCRWTPLHPNQSISGSLCDFDTLFIRWTLIPNWRSRRMPATHKS